MLLLPNVAELVADEVVGSASAGGPAQEDRPPEGVAVVPAETRKLEEERHREDHDAVEPDGAPVEAEAVESDRRPFKRGARLPAAPARPRSLSADC